MSWKNTRWSVLRILLFCNMCLVKLLFQSFSKVTTHANKIIKRPVQKVFVNKCSNSPKKYYRKYGSRQHETSVVKFKSSWTGVLVSICIAHWPKRQEILGKWVNSHRNCRPHGCNFTKQWIPLQLFFKDFDEKNFTGAVSDMWWCLGWSFFLANTSYPTEVGDKIKSI